MDELNASTISVEEIMSKIKSEVKSRRSSSETVTSSSPRFKSQPINLRKVNENKNDFVTKEKYVLADFCQYNDLEFISNVYKGILRRSPDEHGMKSRLYNLRSGKQSKTEILSLVRFSSEGKRNGVRVEGIKLRFLQTIIYRIPIIGVLVKFIFTLFTLPNLVTRLNKFENNFSALSEICEENDLLLKDAINLKVDIEALERKADRVELDGKADRVELDGKADRVELGAESSPQGIVEKGRG